jgi:hypothetical protein
MSVHPSLCSIHHKLFFFLIFRDASQRIGHECKTPLAKTDALVTPKASHSSIFSIVPRTQASTSVVDVGNRSQSGSACLLTSRMDLRRAWDRRDRKFGSFQGSVPLLGGLDRVLGYCPWRARRAILGRGATEGIAVARGLGWAFVRSLRIRFRASTMMLVARRTPDLYSRD